jgi:NAD(P)H-dependent flavin oxidoreductase YrpB (nitropropane dioxygenase family)
LVVLEESRNEKTPKTLLVEALEEDLMTASFSGRPARGP